MGPCPSCILAYGRVSLLLPSTSTLRRPEAAWGRLRTTIQSRVLLGGSGVVLGVVLSRMTAVGAMSGALI